jgi:SAM-dependent methyltransferase
VRSLSWTAQLRGSVPAVEDAELMARRASSFGAVARAYAEHRPGYPAAAVEWVLAPVRDRFPIRVLDLGAGTGRVTEALQRAEVDVIAVEPDPQMRAAMLERVYGVAVLAGAAESIPLPDERVDAVVVGQAFHWFDRDRALPEIARVLKPGGVAAALWNGDDFRVPWAAEYARIAGFGDQEKPDDRPAVSHDAFEPAETAEFDNSYRRTADSLVATLGTLSAYLVMPADERAAKERDVREYLARTPETASGEFDLPLITRAVRMVRR